MKKRSMIVFAALLGLIFSTPGANASYLDPEDGWKNITTYDGLSGDYGGKSSSWWANTNEDQEVEPGAATGQQWDLEGFFLNEGTGELAMVGGFDFLEGQDGVVSGDIFIDTDMDPGYYEYVLDLDFRTGGKDNKGKKNRYTVYENSDNKEITYNPTHGGPAGPTQGQPYSRDRGGKKVHGYQNLAINYLANIPDSDIAGGTLQGGSHNAVIVDVSFLKDYSNATFYSRLECGNDGMQGGGSAAVPEPATIFLLGSGLLGLFGFRKKIRKSDR